MSPDDSEALNRLLEILRGKNAASWILEERLVQNRLISECFGEGLIPVRVVTGLRNGVAKVLWSAVTLGVGGAALDVFETEPLPLDSWLWNRPNLLLTPHVAGTTPHYVERALEIFLDNARHYLADEPFSAPVDVTHGY